MMDGKKTRIIIFLLSITLLSVVAIPAAKQKKEMQCRGTDMNLSEAQMQQTLDCLGQTGVTSIWKIPASDFPCFGMCMLKARGFISTDGEHVVLDHVVKYINTAVPEPARAEVLTSITKCVKEHGDKVSEKNDQHCMTFLEVGQCIRDAFIDGCVE